MKDAITIKLQILVPTVLCIGSLFVIFYRVNALETEATQNKAEHAIFREKQQDALVAYKVIQNQLESIHEEMRRLREELGQRP